MTCDLVSSQLTDEQKGRLCGVLSVGCDRQTAAGLVGCSLADIRRAMQHDGQFAAGVRRAEARSELSHIRNIQQAAQEAKNWRASVWWLEQHSPERFGRRGAGVVTARQIKAFVDILMEILHDDVKNADERRQVITRLVSLSDSVDQMLRDASITEAASTALGQVLADLDPSPSFASSREEFDEFD